MTLPQIATLNPKMDVKGIEDENSKLIDPKFKGTTKIMQSHTDSNREEEDGTNLRARFFLT